ncbi:hypothetical protein CHELA40_13117 [Chelatococcus asaccharovorans]|nr:hypothetical protein CHELA40_13117 [Chelatococcus asaccharovorans]CAH1680231.1 hypothetical protein CHELA17_62504 [Chelatococcus asaccharovorans]
MPDGFNHNDQDHKTLCTYPYLYRFAHYALRPLANVAGAAPVALPPFNRLARPVVGRFGAGAIFGEGRRMAGIACR